MNEQEQSSTLVLDDVAAAPTVRHCEACGKRMRSDTKDQLCSACRAKELEAGRKNCLECGKRLNRGNESNYCANHFHLSREPHVRELAAAQGRKIVCTKCGRRLNSHNKTFNSETPLCGECNYVVKPGNVRAHARAQARKCQEGKHCTGGKNGAPAILGNNNKSGYCMVCWMRLYGSAPERKQAAKNNMAAFRARERAKAEQREFELKKAEQNLVELRATALPDDWRTKPAEDVFIGLILLQRAYMTNDELATALEASGGPPCQYSEDGSWDCITRPGPAANRISKIRKWVRKPGRGIKLA